MIDGHELFEFNFFSGSLDSLAHDIRPIDLILLIRLRLWVHLHGLKSISCDSKIKLLAFMSR